MLKKLVPLLLVFIFILSGSASAASLTEKDISIYSNDGKTFLGNLSTNTSDSNSIFNTYGKYGSVYQTKSIWNPYGSYGSEYSNTSAFNEYATKPPILVVNGKIIAYVTVNKYNSKGISPLALWSLAEEL